LKELAEKLTTPNRVGRHPWFVTNVVRLSHNGRNEPIYDISADYLRLADKEDTESSPKNSSDYK
jgi:hypothetical protein